MTAHNSSFLRTRNTNRKSTQKQNAARRAMLGVEHLEDRTLLAADTINTIASFHGELTAGEELEIVRIHVTQDNFTIGGGHVTLGFVVKPGEGSGLKPDPVEVSSLAPGNVPVIEARVLADGSSLVLAKLKHGDHDVHLAGADDTTGTWQLHVFLAGDANGDYAVDQTDKDILKDLKQGKSNNPEHLAAGDSNRDGKITGFDEARASNNKGSSTTVRVLDVTAALDPASDTGIAGDNLVNQTPVNVIGATVPGAGVFLDEDGDGFDDGTTTASAGTPTNYVLPADLAEGANTLVVEARDDFGQTAQAQTVVTLDTVAPTVASTTPAEGAGVEAVPGVNDAVTIELSEKMIGSSVVPALTVSGNESGTITPLNASYDDATNTLSFELSEALLDSAITVQVGSGATDLAGNSLAPFTLNFTINRFPRIRSISPANGEALVSLTREAIVRFTSPIDPSTITSESLKVIALGSEVPGRRVVSSTKRFVTFFPDQPWNASTEVRIRVDGNVIKGTNGKNLDGDGDGTPGGVATADFRTLPITRIPNTNVFGFVRDSFTEAPIAGATIRVDAFPEANAVTDANGRFELVDMPAPEFFVHVDGSTADTGDPNTVYPSVGKPFHSVPGQTVQLNVRGVPFDVFLPPMALSDVQPLSATEPTDVGFGDKGKADLADLFPDVDPSTWDLLKVNFAPGAAVDEFGNPATEASIIPVPPDRIPAPLPPNLNPELVISIQAGGATNFDVPAPITFPNLEGLAPGEKSLIFSFDHDAGQWVVVGTGTVTEDGLSIVSDPGVGIVAPGWHFVISGTRNRLLVNLQSSDGCGRGDDFMSGDFPIGPVLLNPLIVGLPPSNPYPFINRLLTPTPILEAEFRAYLVALQTGALGQQMVTRFMNGSGTDFTHPNGSELSNLAANSIAFQTVFNDLSFDIREQIQAQANNGHIDNRQLTVTAPLIHFSILDGLKIKSLIGGTQGLKLDLNDFNATGTIISPDVGGSGTYSGTLRFEICDDFGVDGGDTYAPPLAAFWVLQHYRTGHRPFQNKIIIEKPISGGFIIPPGFEDIIIDISNSAIQTALVGGAPAAVGSTNNPLQQLEPGISTSAGFGTDPTVYYRYVIDNGIEISGTINSDGFGPDVILSPNRFFTATFYQPSTNQSTVVASVSSVSGELTLFSDSPGGFGENGSVVNLTDFGGLDSDGDGIPDVGEFAIGTSSTSRDTDMDGILDNAEIEQGLDPLDNRGFPTGIISNLPLPGSAREVVVEESSAFVATDSHGLAIVDVSQFNNPILLGQIDLTGTATDVAAAPELDLVAVATGSGGVQIVDVADPMTPSLVDTVDVSGTHLEVVDGVAYVANGTSLTSIDLLSGDVLQTLNLFGGTITDVAKEGSFLYTMDNFRRLRAVDISTGDMIARGIAFMPQGAGKLFVGNGIAYAAAGATTSQGGYATADVSNPDSLVVLSGTDAPVESAPGTAIVTNGSGVGLLIGQSQRVAGDPSSLQLVDVTDPTNTYDLLLQIGLPTPPQSIAVASGIAFIADGTSGLQVVNYLPFDSAGVAPTVTISTPVADIDPATDGVQVLEGTSIPVRADVLDDVQARNVELLVNGEVVSNDVTFPFDFFATAPNITPESSQLTLQVRATDTGGNTGLSNVLTIDLVEDTFGPIITSIDPSDGSTLDQGHRTFRVRFSEPIDTASILASGNVFVVEAGADGSFGTGDDVVIPIRNVQFRGDDTLVQLTTDPLDVGSYQLEIRNDAVTDRAGNAIGTGLTTSSLTIANVAPRFANLEVTQEVDENGVATLTGEIIDPGAQDTFTLTVDWAEGDPETLSFAAGTTSFAVTHRYLDDNPTGTPSDDYSLTLTIADNHGGSNSVSGRSGSSGPIRVAAIGGNSGNRAMNQVFGSGDLEGSVVRIFSTTAFNSLTPAQLRDSYDVVFVTWASSGSLNLDWSTRLLPYMQLGGNVIWEDPNNVGDISSIVSTRGGSGSGSMTFTEMVPGLTDGIAGSFSNNHITFSTWAPELSPFMSNSGGVVGLYGEFSGSRIVLTGPDQDFHAFRANDQYRFLVNELRWVTENSLSVTVNNVSPVVNAIVGPDPSPAVEGEAVSFTSSFTDVGTLDTHEVQWDFGDGTILPFTASTSSGALTPTHTYVASGTFTVTLTVRDDDGGIASVSKSVTVVSGTPLQSDSRLTGHDARFVLDQRLISPILASAIDLWTSAGADSITLDQVDVRVTDLAGARLGLATESGVIWLDRDAAGAGWFVDSTPWEHSEFALAQSSSSLAATDDSPAWGRQDLLTVLLHEVGHLLGHEHSGDNGVMAESLGPGSRRLPDAGYLAEHDEHVGMDLERSLPTALTADDEPLLDPTIVDAVLASSRSGSIATYDFASSTATLGAAELVAEIRWEDQSQASAVPSATLLDELFVRLDDDLPEDLL